MKVNNWLMILWAMIFLNGCVENKSDMEHYVDTVKKTAQGKLEPIPPPKVIKGVEYTSENLRSPFVLTGGAFSNVPSVIMGPNSETIHQQPRPDLARPREYLEQFPLTSLMMVGTLSKPELNWALIKDANGMIHAVKIGDYLGFNSGKIIAITPDQIRVTETIPDGSGGWRQSVAMLDLVPSTEPTTMIEEAQPTSTEKSQQKQPAANKVTPAKPAKHQPNAQPKSQSNSHGGGG